ncbi:MAG TPA: glycerophosphodiester phosphodiesterase family protein [Thermoanaerobaculia bacterium]|nr:glycerophosphodiester phosphodiesterase family protein [Thermoanaerobaculia bacterium]
MTLLGYRNPARRLWNAARGLLHRRAAAAASDRPFFVVGHRGAARFEAENTIPSFEKGLELGANAVETDVCVTRDGHFVLWHDCHPDDKVAVARQAGAEKDYLYDPEVPAVGSRWRRAVPELTLEELRAHYGYVPRKGRRPAKARVGIALLADFFEWSRREERLELVCLDVKLGENEGAAARDLASSIRDGLRAGRIRKDLSVALLCPHEETLQAVLTESRREPLGKNVGIFGDFEFPGGLDFAKRFGMRCLSFGVSRRFWAGFRDELARVLAAREAGRIDEILVWTINEEEQLRELVDLGVDGILTDDSALLRRIAGVR